MGCIRKTPQIEKRRKKKKRRRKKAGMGCVSETP